ncbi:MAG: divalent-cation tolerance protein CutA [Thiotrichales bacterium]
MTEIMVVLTTWPDREGAEKVAAHLVESGLAACINILPPMTSIYRWEGKTQQGTEHQLVIKTTSTAYPELEQYLLNQHPYELPEILCIPVDKGLPAYMNWVKEISND